MDAKKYTNAIARKIRCDGKKKKEIKRQLLMDIDMRMKQGEQVETAMKETIELLDAEDYAALQENAILQMKPVLNAETIDGIRGTLSDDWGERKQFGAVYMAELVQGNKHFAVGEITVTYENVSATYRLTYDEDMRFAGIYVR